MKTTPLLYRAGLRYLWRHPWQLALAILGVATGVAVVVGIDLANQSARRAFERSVDAVAGRATHQITGGPAGLDEAVYVALRRAGFRSAAPLVEAWVGVPERPGRALRLLGVDPFAEPPVRVWGAALEGENALGDFLVRPGAVLLGRGLAAELGVGPGDSLETVSSGRVRMLSVVGLLDAADGLETELLRDLLLVDVASAQEILDRPGRLSRIDLALGDPTGDAGPRLEALRALLPAGATLEARQARAGTLEQMTRAFRLNLTALSLLALLVGAFLIYNTMSFSVVQRRELFGLLRALGATRREILALVLGEAAAIGLVATAAGIALGVLLARQLLALVVRTINDLYFVLAVSELSFDPMLLVKSLVLGVVATVLAALGPAREAARVAPRAAMLRSTLETRARRGTRRSAMLGLAAILLAAALLALPTRDLALSFTAVFLFVVGGAGLVPVLSLALLALLRPALRFLGGAVGQLAARGVAASLSRTGVALAALVVAVATTVGVAVMVESFRDTVVGWLATSLRADVYATPAELATRGQPTAMAPDAIARLIAAPEVDFATTHRRVEVPSPAGSVQLLALGLAASEPGVADDSRWRRALGGFRLRGATPETIARRLDQGAVMISEPFAYHRRLAVGDAVALSTERGLRSFPIAAIFEDYASDRGLVLMARSTYGRLFDDPAIHALGLYARPGIDPEHLLAGLRARHGGGQRLRLVQNRVLREQSMAIFDRTFAITRVLRLLAVAVAFVGVLAALLARELERGRELAILRANGLTPGQAWGLVGTESGLIGLIAGLLAIPMGLGMAALLVQVINRRSFGWTLEMTVSPAALALALVLALVAALLAGVYPAWRAARVSPARALQAE